MKRNRFFELALCTLLLFSCQNEKGIFYVSPNGNDEATGTKQSPWKSVNNAVKQIQKFATKKVFFSIF